MADAPQGPTVFNERYELHRKLAHGGMADVYLARDLLLDRPVAVKVLFPEYARDSTFVERFRREAKAAANLNHPNVVAVYDWGEQGGTYFIVMEYVEGRPLSEIIRSDGPVHPMRAAEISSDVAAALAFAHRNGVVHRDIKPGNILITPTGQVKVADFGIAQALTSDHTQANLTQVGAVMGTATYFSPEQAQGRPVDPRSDLYSLGCVLYEMITAQPPFTGESPLAIAYKHVQEWPEPPAALNPQVPPALAAIDLKLLAKSPDGRYASAEDLRADLARFMAGQPVLAAGGDPGVTQAVPHATVAGVAAGAAMAGAAAGGPPTGTVPPTGDPDAEDPYGSEPPRRGRGMVVALVVLLLVLAGVLVVLGMQLTRGSDDVVVPNVERMERTAAEAALVAEGFRVVVEEVNNNEFAAGQVFDQSPSGGSRAAEGATVTLQVSLGRGEVPVPDLLEMTAGQAGRAVANAELVGEELQETSDEPAGRVLRQAPAPGVLVERGSTVQYWVSAGPEQVAVPAVEGRTSAEATAQLQQARLRVSESPETSTSVAVGLVIRTSPAVGSQVPVNTTVTIFVSTGPPTTTSSTTSTTTTSTTSTTSTTTTSTTTTTLPPPEDD
jgi:beta-lactam-binding protein with PASTA domain/tRNA A-37 threonylcarbamoyl transferase component Bud32